MRHSLFWTLCTLVMTSAVGLCQPGSPVNPKLVAISTLQRKGEDAAAIKAGKALFASGSLSPREQVQLLGLLGLANTDLSNFQEASRDYEQALSLIGHDASAMSDRAAVLNAYGALYRDQGQLDVAIRLRSQALDLYRQLNNHEGIAIASNNLAALYLAQKHTGQAERYLKQATDEAKLVKDMDLADRAGIASNVARLHAMQGHVDQAVQGYTDALALFIESHGAGSASVGWMEVVLASAYDLARQTDKALEKCRDGLMILERTQGQKSRKYLSAKLIYATILEHSGAHDAARLAAQEARAGLQELAQNECASCTITVSGLK
jgi:tetratricopeptide (TPR) repeat protein